MQGEFRKGGKVADKNVEVTLTVCNQDGDVIEVSYLQILSVKTYYYIITVSFYTYRCHCVVFLTFCVDVIVYYFYESLVVCILDC